MAISASERGALKLKIGKEKKLDVVLNYCITIQLCMGLHEAVNGP